MGVRSELTWELLGRFFDGEGTFYYRYRTPTRLVIRVALRQKDRAILEEIKRFIEDYRLKAEFTGNPQGKRGHLSIGNLRTVIH